MRIVIISFGGHGYYPPLFIKSIIEKKADVLAFVPEEQKAMYREVLGNTDCIKFYTKRRMRNPLNLKVLHDIFKQIDSIKPDVVHLLSYFPWLFFYKWKIKKYRLVLTVHDPVKHSGDIETQIVPGSEKQLYSCAAHIITLGERMRQQLLADTGHAESRVSVIFHGNFNIYSQRASSEFSEEDNIVLFLGRLYAYKGVEYLIKAADEVQKVIPQSFFIIAGSGSKKYTGKLKKMIAGKEHLLLIDQYISERDMAEHYQKAAISVLPYTEASQSGALLVSYAFKKAIIATDTGSIPEYVDDGKTGFIIPPRDPQALAGKIIQLFENPKLRKQMGDNGYRKATEEYSWKITAGQAIDIYSNLVETEQIKAERS